MKPRIIEVEEDPMTHELFMQLPDDVLASLNINIGDELLWEVQPDGSVFLSKKEPEEVVEAVEETIETELVLVDAITMYRMRYVVEVPKGKAVWALDTVTCNEAEEFSQKHLEEVISSHRVITKEEFIKIFNEDNDYMADWSDELKLQRFVTRPK